MVSINKYDIIDLIIKFNNEDALNYVRNIVLDDEHIRYLINNPSSTKNIIKDIEQDYKFLNIFHNVYQGIKNIKEIYNTHLYTSLFYFDEAYNKFKKAINVIEMDKTQAIILNEEEAILKMNNNIEHMKKVDDMDVTYPYNYLAQKIICDKDEFSLDSQFSEEGFNYLQGLNSVTVITPNQTISRFNDDSVNGLKGSGHHDANFLQIIETIYGKRFNNATTGQDIKIRYVTEMKSKDELSYKMTIEMPLIINSMQKKSLNILNDEIKRFEEMNNHNIEIYVLLIDYNNKDYFKTFNYQSDLDSILNEVIIDDNKTLNYKELYFIGYANNENHYKKDRQK